MEAARYERLTNLSYEHCYFKFENKTHKADLHHVIPQQQQH